MPFLGNTGLTRWEDIDKLPPKEKNVVLQQILRKREPIKSFSDFKPGDHLVKKSSIGDKVAYEHHFLCIEVGSNNRPKIIHYYNTAKNAAVDFIKTGSFGSSSKMGRIAIIQEITLPHKDMIESESELQKKGAEVERVVWPDYLRPFPAEEVIQRAKGRLGEKSYDLETNNCESFVMWCICGLNYSVQSATPWRVIAIEAIKCFVMTLFHGTINLPKITVECVEKALNCSCLGNAIAHYGIESLSLVGCTAGIGLALLIDVACLSYSIYASKKKWDKGILIQSREQFFAEVVKEILLCFLRVAGGVGGYFVFQIFVPIPVVGGLIGMLIGGTLGYLIGRLVVRYRLGHIASALEAWYLKITEMITKKFPKLQTVEAKQFYRILSSTQAHD